MLILTLLFSASFTVTKLNGVVVALSLTMPAVMKVPPRVGAVFGTSVMVKVALGVAVFSNTETVLEPELATAKSSLPSPLKSPVLTERGVVPVA